MKIRIFGLRGLLVLVMLGALPLAEAHAQLKGDTYAQAKQKGEANIMYSYNETPGFLSRDAAGNLNGLCIDLMQAFGMWLKKYEGIELKPRFYGEDTKDFKKFLANVQSAKGGVFGIGSITITDERKKDLSFSVPFITNVAVLISHQDVPELRTKNELAKVFASMQAVAVKGTTNEAWLNKLKKEAIPALSFQYVHAGDEALKQVAKNPRLFTQLDFIYYLNAVDAGLPVRRHTTADETSQRLGIAMPLGSDWSPLLDRFMKAFVNSNEYRKIVAKNLGPNALKLLDSVQASQSLR